MCYQKKRSEISADFDLTYLRGVINIQFLEKVTWHLHKHKCPNLATLHLCAMCGPDGVTNSFVSSGTPHPLLAAPLPSRCTASFYWCWGYLQCCSFQVLSSSSGRLAFLSLPFLRKEAFSGHPRSSRPLPVSLETVVPWTSYYSGFPFPIFTGAPFHWKSEPKQNHKHARRKHQLVKSEVASYLWQETHKGNPSKKRQIQKRNIF